MKLRDRVALITGGARGIGKKISETFLKEGSSVYIFDVNKDEGEKAEAEFKKAYGDDRAGFFKLDITDEGMVEKSIAKIIEAERKEKLMTNPQTHNDKDSTRERLRKTLEKRRAEKEQKSQTTNTESTESNEITDLLKEENTRLNNVKRTIEEKENEVKSLDDNLSKIQSLYQKMKVSSS